MKILLELATGARLAIDPDYIAGFLEYPAVKAKDDDPGMRPHCGLIIQGVPNIIHCKFTFDQMAVALQEFEEEMMLQEENAEQARENVEAAAAILRASNKKGN